MFKTTTDKNTEKNIDKTMNKDYTKTDQSKDMASTDYQSDGQVKQDELNSYLNSDCIYRGRSVAVIGVAGPANPGYRIGEDQLVIQYKTGDREREVVLRSQVARSKDEAVRIEKTRNPESFKRNDPELNPALDGDFAKQSMEDYNASKVREESTKEDVNLNKGKKNERASQADQSGSYTHRV